MEQTTNEFNYCKDFVERCWASPEEDLFCFNEDETEYTEEY